MKLLLIGPLNTRTTPYPYLNTQYCHIAVDIVTHAIVVVVDVCVDVGIFLEESMNNDADDLVAVILLTKQLQVAFTFCARILV